VSGGREAVVEVEDAASWGAVRLMAALWQKFRRPEVFV
jgi:hypothetical protein